MTEDERLWYAARDIVAKIIGDGMVDEEGVAFSSPEARYMMIANDVLYAVEKVGITRFRNVCSHPLTADEVFDLAADAAA
jgi:hypothetical protein